MAQYSPKVQISMISDQALRRLRGFARCGETGQREPHFEVLSANALASGHSGDVPPIFAHLDIRDSMRFGVRPALRSPDPSSSIPLFYPQPGRIHPDRLLHITARSTDPNPRTTVPFLLAVSRVGRSGRGPAGRRQSPGRCKSTEPACRNYGPSFKNSLASHR
ncbi:hypothetical protein NM680_09830 [Paracoccus sp. PS-1]|uniref:hypothetical protein n=1 Tax=unclassified Paracoccus (in: a-proteobacteria) TaxID=2688777 RepID=UPI0012EB49A2|nr:MULTISPECIES: hypothetical protein [unclassified Paracoccus (in: a-proteobacteria)]MDQ7262094.1 hypothetical protein [Paracoccus sp. PS1]